jgi:hypothetical protein
VEFQISHNCSHSFAHFYVAKLLNDDCMVPIARLQVGVNTLTFFSVNERCGVNAADCSSILFKVFINEAHTSDSETDDGTDKGTA